VGTPAALPEAVFHVDGEHAVPTELARGPWSPDAQHGGAPGALLARAVEQCDPGPADFVTRLTIELLGPVPLTLLRIAARTIRPGKKVQWVEASLFDGEREVVHATGLRVRTEDLGLPQVVAEHVTMPAPDQSEGLKLSPLLGGPDSLGFWHAMEVRLARGSWTEPGPGAVWFRLRVPIVAGETPSALQRVAAAADFGNGISAALEHGKYLFINPDLTVALHRSPIGEWVGLDAHTSVEPVGVGLAAATLHDEHGPIGRSMQCLLVDRL
jgi:acyl-Coa thioesterase superfamily protein/acyl-CoA thioesterase superfamily protein